MANYHVGAGIAGIYAGTTYKNGYTWANKSEVTDEAICAVRDYLKHEANSRKQNSFGYEWKLKDGRTVELMLTIKEGAEDENA